MIEEKCLKIRFNQLTLLNGIDIVVKQGLLENLFGNLQQARIEKGRMIP